MTGRVIKSVSIRTDQDKWIDKHPEINLSGLLQYALDRKIQQLRK